MSREDADMELPRKRIRVACLSPEQLDRMYALMKDYYENVDRLVFESDLKEKDWVLVINDDNSDRIVGFSTQVLFHMEFLGENIQILFSGDTIISKDHWGSMALIKAFGELILELIERHHGTPLYWLLISKGLRTYKYLPTCFKEFYPNWITETPAYILNLMHHLGQIKFPQSYNRECGIIEAYKGSQYLKKEFHPVPNSMKPYESFFYKVNPGYIKGDELLCLAKLCIDNIQPFILKVLTSRK